MTTASEQAQASGDPVVVEDLTTETRQVTADPDGTFTLTSNRQPVRIQRNGKWIPIDTGLVRGSDGNYRPRATDAELTFSGGGTGPALVIGDPTSNASVSVTWPGGLPAPSINGPAATYSDVLPGVDLVLTAQTQSYSETLVVHDATAAANPDLRNLRMTFAAHDLMLQKASDGGLSASDEAGAQVFDGDVPVMWDSSYDPRVGAAPTASDPGGAMTTPVPISIPSIDGTAGTATTTAVLSPSTTDLTGGDVSYPVYIDPTLSRLSPAHTMVVSSGAAPNNLHMYDNTADLKVGDCAWSGCNSIGVARSFFSFDIAPLTGPNSWQDGTAKVADAEVDAYQIHNSNGCTAEPVTLYTTGAFTSGTVWPGPAYSTNLGTVSNGYSDDCGSGTGGYDKFTSSDLATHVQYGATLGTTITFGLKAPDETNMYQWKRFSTNPTLVVHFSYAPTRLAATGIDGAVTCDGHTYLSSATPTLNGTAHDNNSPHVPLVMRFSIYNPDGSMLSHDDQNATTPSSPDTQLYRGSSHSQTFSQSDNGTTFSYGVNAYTQVPSGDPSYQWGTASSTFSFTPDFAPPTGTISIGSSDYPRENWGASPNQPGTFYLRNDSTDAVGFSYQFDGAPPPVTGCSDNVNPDKFLGWLASSGGQASITAPPTLTAGRHTLSVSMYNGAHVSSAAQTYSFYVSPTSGSNVRNRAEAEDSSRISYPAGGAASSNMVDLTRWINNTDRFTVAGPATPSGSTLQTGLGMAFSAPGTPGTIAMYDCQVNGEHFDSTDAACEGRTRTASTPEAYIWLNQPSGSGVPPTSALYRCRTSSGDHFDSNSSNCENNTVEGTLGYVRGRIAGLASPRLSSLTSNDGIRTIATTGVGSSFTMTFNAPVEADYAIGVGLVTGPQNGRVQFAISTDGGTTPLGENAGSAPVDASSTGLSARYTLLGGPHLSAGSHAITGTIAGAGSSGGYGVDLDYLTIAPINNMSAVPNDVLVTADGSSTYNGSDNTGTLSQNALLAAGYQPGHAFTAANGIQFTPFGQYGSNSFDNIKPGANSSYQLPTAVGTGKEIDLMVLSAGGDTPDPQATYVFGLNYGDPTNPSNTYLNDRLPVVPNWHSALQFTPVTEGSGAQAVTREPALTLHKYNSGTSTVNADVQLYVLRIPISPTTDLPLTSITLPHSDTAAGQLHVLAINAH